MEIPIQLNYRQKMFTEKPILKNNLLMPLATKNRINEIKEEINSVNSPVIINGLFLMLVSYLESMRKEILRYYLKYFPEKINKEKIEISINIIRENRDFYLIESFVSEYIEKISNSQILKIFYRALDIKEPDKDLNNNIKNIQEKRNQLKRF